jgi:hypothetical protein
LDLALLLEVTELYCLVCPGPVPVVRDGWLGLSQAASTAPYDALAGFAATCGDALLGITEYLVEDVLLVARQAAEDAAARGAHAGSSTATSGAASSSSPGGGAAGRSSSSNSSGNAAGAAGAAAASSSSSKVRPVAGGQNPTVTLEHRLWWAQDAVSIVGHLMQQQEDLDGERIMSGQYKDTGEVLVGKAVTEARCSLEGITSHDNTSFASSSPTVAICVPACSRHVCSLHSQWRTCHTDSAWQKLWVPGM